uniref:Galaxin-like n=1 Tax=Acrobeloides nanus TaxID=290746 RepID=A0A914E9B1_9BILA
MYGISCCGSEPINQFEEICCEDVARQRRQGSTYVDRCCGNHTVAYDQTCCQGIVHNVPNGECCGSQAYSRTNLAALCCAGVLNLNVELGSICCGKTPYDGGTKESCCGGQVYIKELHDSCCPVHGSDPQEYQPYNSKTHQCCDVPIERFSNIKCCYIRASNGTFFPKSYDFTKQCCAYPFTSLTEKENGTC